MGPNTKENELNGRVVCVLLGKPWTAENKKFVRAYYTGRGIPHTFTSKFDHKITGSLLPGDVFLGFGQESFEAFQAWGTVPKNLGVGAASRRVWNVFGHPCGVTFDPYMRTVDWQASCEMVWHLQLIARVLKTGESEPTLGEYRYVDDFTDAIAHIQRRYRTTKQRQPVVLDLETVSTDPFNPEAHIVSVSLSWQPGMSDVVYFENQTDPAQPAIPKWENGRCVGHRFGNAKLYGQLSWLASNPSVVVRGANFKYDMLWTTVHWGIGPWKTFSFDTTVVGSLLDENRSNSLNLHAKLFTSLGGYDDNFNLYHDKSRMDLVPRHELLPYAGGDTDAGYQVSDKFAAHLIKDKKLTNFYVNLLHPAIEAFRVLEHRGVRINVERAADVRQRLIDERAESETKALSLLTGRIKAKYADNLSLTRKALLMDFFFTKIGLNLKPKEFTATGLPKTDKNHLKKFEGHPAAGPFLEQYRRWQQADRTLGTYVDGWLACVRADGMLHPSYMLYHGAYIGSNAVSGAVTGRTAVKDPAWQTLPKHTVYAKLLRSMFDAPPGYVILSVDFSQGELRVTACVANEPTMIKLYRKNIDMHLATGAEVNGITLQQAMALDPKEMRPIRQGGKAGNFGLIYGMKPPGFVEYAQNTYGVFLTERAAEKFSNAFFDKYSRLPQWHEESKAFARAHGFVRSPLGRVRHLPLIRSENQEVRSQAERQSINSPIQSTLSDMGLLALVELQRLYPELWVFGFTHDDISCYVPADELDTWAERVTGVMENLPFHKFGWRPQVNFKADASVGHNLGALKELA